LAASHAKNEKKKLEKKERFGEKKQHRTSNLHPELWERVVKQQQQQRAVAFWR